MLRSRKCSGAGRQAGRSMRIFRWSRSLVTPVLSFSYRGEIELEKLLRVLIVEDDAIIASLLVETVIGLGHVVCAVAATEADAVDYARDHQPDLMIVDAGLAEGNGLTAVEAILAEQHTPHLFVTGDARRVRSLFPDAPILEKPFFLPELIAAIDRALAQATVS